MERVFYYNTNQYTYDEETIFKSITNLFELMKLDEQNIGLPEWNPLSEYIKPGQSVLIKPNLVMDKNISGYGNECLYTQMPVVKAVLIYAIKALCGNGKITIGDAPMQECDFEKLVAESGYQRMIESINHIGVDIQLVDFRETITKKKNGIRYSESNFSKGVVVDLKSESEFSVLPKQILKRLRITNYDPAILAEHHNESKHEYCISEYVLHSDVIINIPKPKTHKKAGITCALKNMVGINVRKEYLPHHTLGDMSDGGDQYKKGGRLKKFSSLCFDKKNAYERKRKYVRAFIFYFIGGIIKYYYTVLKGDSLEGSWSHNETISKTIIDLNKIIFYADKKGCLKRQPQRKIFTICDMIISGEGEGPVAPSSKKVGFLVAGDNMVAIDVSVATMMGADISKIPTLRNAKNIVGDKLLSKNEVVKIVSNDSRINNIMVNDINDEVKWMFQPSNGWKDAFYSTNF